MLRFAGLRTGGVMIINYALGLLKALNVPCSVTGDGGGTDVSAIA